MEPAKPKVYPEDAAINMLRKYLGGDDGKALLEAHGLRRSLGPMQRFEEGTGGAVFDIHLKGRKGFLRPAGQLYISNAYRSGDRDVNATITATHFGNELNPKLRSFTNKLASELGFKVMHEKK